MSKSNIKSFKCILADSIDIDNSQWSYQVQNLPKPSLTNAQSLVKNIAFVANSEKQEIALRLQGVSLNRGISEDPLDYFILLSFADFRPRVSQASDSSTGEAKTRPATARESSDYIIKVLRAGITLNHIHYNFYGHSNSQLKSRTCFLFAASPKVIEEKVKNLGDFSKMKTVAKKAKRIGLLFSTAQMATTLDPSRCEDVPDIERGDYIFTDGCGLVSPHFAREISRKRKITFRNTRYTPSVFQIRYRGYKGVVMLDPAMKGKTLIKFRKSMKKFSGGTDLSFSVVDYSKPYGFGYLNDEIILLLHALGIGADTLLKKQKEHFDFLSSAVQDPRNAFRFLTYVNNFQLAEEVLMNSLESCRPAVAKLVNSEYDRMLNKRDEQRCRILIPQSRLLFGICDAWGVLKEGECAIKITMDGDGQPRAIKGMEVLVTRNPCLHPGDLQKFRAVEKVELSHLVDCIIFPTNGRRPAADMMSGGDLDGDTFFVCWDHDLIPAKLSQPAEYPGGKEPVSFKPITDDDRLVYFAKYNNSSLGRAKNLFLDWARLKGPMSAECQQLNRLFSMSVDGERIKIPEGLESLPKPLINGPEFILDVLHNAAVHLLRPHSHGAPPNIDGLNFNALELLLSRDDMAVSEFELVKLTYRWCRQNQVMLEDFIWLFDINLLTAEEKHWLMDHLPPSLDTPRLLMNALCSSNLLQPSELQHFKLNFPGLRWKCVYDSSVDRIANFLDSATRYLEVFHRKLIVMRVDERLTLAIYVPRKVEHSQECRVDNQVRLFAFPHTQGEETSFRLSLPTKHNYRLYCDGNVFQLYERVRGNSWVFITRGPSNDSAYRNQETIGGRRRARQETIDEGANFDFRASIALDKFSQGLKQHIGRIYRSGVLGAEIYIISNRDVQSMQSLDLWLNLIDTQEVMPLFDRTAKEYSTPSMKGTNWSEEPQVIRDICRDKKYSAFDLLDSEKDYFEIFTWLLDKGERGQLLQCFHYLLNQVELTKLISSPPLRIQTILRAMIDFLRLAPFLSITFTRLDLDIASRDVQDLLRNSSPRILEAFILSANDAQDLVTEPFRKVLSRIERMSFSSFASLVELISLTVRSPEVALDLLLEGLERQSLRILIGDPLIAGRFVKCLLGIAMDHMDEATETHLSRKDLLELSPDGSSSNGYPIVKCKLRIDAPFSSLAANDHVRLTVANPPTNSISNKKLSIDALVESCQGGVRFRCFHPLPPFIEQCSWELKNCGSFVTSATMNTAVLTLATEMEECCGVANLIWEKQQSSPVNYEAPPIIFKTKNKLNDSQNLAVEIALKNTLTCLWGPPGTGKTTTLVELIKDLRESHKDHRILVTAPTHNAVDNVMRKFLEESPSSKTIAIRVSTDVRKVASDLRPFTCDAMLGKEIYSSHVSMKRAREQVKKCPLVFTTCIGSGLGLLRSELFDIVIIDEASQLTEPASLVPLVKGCQKAILVGDHVQLRATVQKHAVLQEFDVSLFERLYRRNEEDGNAGKGGICKVMLDTQYRMHEDIYISRPLPVSLFPWPSVFPLKSTASTKAFGVVKPRMIFIECSSSESLGGKSKSNEGQAALCLEVCKLLCSDPPTPITPTTTKEFTTKNDTSVSISLPPLATQSIAVLTPYSLQATLLKARLSHLSNVEVSSIDGFQGREADIVVFVTVRCNAHCEIGFLKDLRRMNVALTRAKRGVIVIGNRRTLTEGEADEESTAVWKRLVGGMREVKLEVGI